MKEKKHPAASRELRRKAEEKLRHENIPLTPEAQPDRDRALHELRVHQVELQMQNEHLREAQEHLEKMHSQYVELFDFAPVGYLLIDRKGVILKANLTATGLLDRNRDELVATNLTQYIDRLDVDRWYLYRKELFKQGRPDSIDLQLRSNGARYVHLRSDPIANRKGSIESCRVAMLDITEKKQAEEALRQSEAQYRTLAEHAPCIVARFDNRLRHTYVNTAAEKVTGIPAEQFIGKTNKELGFPEDLCRALSRLLSEVFRTGRPGHMETEYQGVSGPGYFAVNAVPEFAEDGSVESVLGIIHDITSIRKAQIALSEKEERLRLAVQGGSLGTWDRDLLTGKVVWNDLLYEMLGREPKGSVVAGETFFEYIHPDDTERVRRHVDGALESDDVFEDEFRVIRKDGRVRWLVSTGRIYRDEDGRPIRMAGVNYDITERKEFEEALRSSEARLRNVLRHRDAQLRDEERKRGYIEDELWESEQKYRMLVDNLPAITYLASPDEKPVLYYVSPQVGSLLGYEPGDQVADFDFWLSRIHPDDRRRVLEEGKKARQQDKPLICEFRILDSEDHVKWFRHEARSIQDEGEPLFTQGIMYDITLLHEQRQRIEADSAALERLTEELLKTEHREREAVAIALHDSVIQLLAFSKRELGPLIKTSSQDTANILSKVYDCLDQAIKESRQLTTSLSSQTLHMFGLVEAVRELLDWYSQEHGIQYSLQAPQEACPLGENVKYLLFRSVREMLTNIAKHAEARNVLVRIDRVDNSMRLEVSDDGNGFDVETVQKQAANKGGFGLFSVKQRITYVGGRFEICSEVGQGTRATLVVPLERRRIAEGNQL